MSTLELNSSIMAEDEQKTPDLPEMYRKQIADLEKSKADLEKSNADLKKSKAELEKKSKADIKEKDIELAKKEAELEKSKIANRETMIMAGKYFATTADVLDVTTPIIPLEKASKTGDVEKIDFMKDWCRKMQSVEALNEATTTQYGYKATIEHYEDEEEPAPPDSGGSIRSGLQHVWPSDIFGGGTKGAQLAHLIPRKRNGLQWMGIAGAALGLEWKAKQKNPEKAEEYMKRLRKATFGVTIKQVQSKKSSVGTKSNASTTAAASASSHSGGGNKTINQKKQANRKKPPLSVSQTQSEKSQAGKTNKRTQPKSKTSQTEKSRRLNNAGLVHSHFNRVRMSQQADYFDKDEPMVLILPCMDREQARGWKGEGYDAIVLAGYPKSAYQVSDSNDSDPSAYQVSDSNDSDTKKPRKPRECVATYQLVGAGSEELAKIYCKNGILSEKAQYDKLQTARLTLEQTLHALKLYKIQIQDMVKDVEDDGKTPTLWEVKSSMDRSLKNIDRVQKSDEIKVPKNIFGIEKTDRKPLLIISFRNTDGEKNQQNPTTYEEFTHPAPDPLLLFAKAAVIWGRMTGVELLANGEVDDDSIDDSYDMVDPIYDYEVVDTMTKIPKEITFPAPSIPLQFVNGHLALQ